MGFLSNFLTQEALSLVASLLASVVVAVCTYAFSNRASKAESNFLLGVQIAYSAVNEIAKRTPNLADDKAALGLKLLAEHLARRISPAEEEKARKLFAALHGEVP